MGIQYDEQRYGWLRQSVDDADDVVTLIVEELEEGVAALIGGVIVGRVAGCPHCTVLPRMGLVATHLPGENHVLANIGGPGQANLRAQQRVFIHVRAMTHLH